MNPLFDLLDVDEIYDLCPQAPLCIAGEQELRHLVQIGLLVGRLNKTTRKMEVTRNSLLEFFNHRNETLMRMMTKID